MSIPREIFIGGAGAVSPAGWGLPALRDAISQGAPLPSKEIANAARGKTLRVRTVPPANPRPSFLANPRLRRSSSISQYTLAAALEAMGGAWNREQHGTLGVIVCVLSGCVGYSRRFYEETLKDPSTASPLVFPETVFNAPASHLSSFLGTTDINYTLVGDAGTFLIGLATAAAWIADQKVDSVLVVGSEEMDWLTADALNLFDPEICFAEGSGALLLTSQRSPVKLSAITGEHLFCDGGPESAALRMQSELLRAAPQGLLIEGSAPGKLGRVETALWKSWAQPRCSPKPILGEGLVCSAAWNSVLGFDALQENKTSHSIISTVGTHQHAIGAIFSKTP